MNTDSNLQILVDEATSTSLQRPNANLNIQVQKAIGIRADLAKEAARCFKKRFLTKEPKVVALTLELLDLCMIKCGNPMHIQVGTKEFMNILVSILNMKNMPQPIQNRVLALIQKWGLRFEKDSDILPLYSDIYKALKGRGIQFPKVPESSAAKQPSEAPKSSPPIRSSQRPGSKPRVQEKDATKKVITKYQKLLQDMNLIKGNINLTNQMIDSSKPADLQSEDNPIIDLLKTLKDMEPKLMNLIATLEDEEMMKVCLIVNDDLHKTFQRCDKLKKGKKPENFIPGESTLNTALTPTHVYEIAKPQPKASSQVHYQTQKTQVKQVKEPASSKQEPPANTAQVDIFDLMAGPPTNPSSTSSFQTQQQPLDTIDFFGGSSEPAQSNKDVFSGGQPFATATQPHLQSQPQPQLPQQQQRQPVQEPQGQKPYDPINKLNEIMKNMSAMTDYNKTNEVQPVSMPTGGLQNQFATNMPQGGMGMGMNPMMQYQQYMTGMQGGMNMGGMNGMAGMGGMNNFGANNFSTNMNPMMGGGFGMGPAQITQYATSAPTSGQMSFGDAPIGGNFAAGPGPKVESFQKDGFNILGKQPIKPKPVDEEGAKEFAELFSIADSKIKDRSQKKPQMSYDYNPITSPVQQQNQITGEQNQMPQVSDAFSNMNIGDNISPVQQHESQQQQQPSFQETFQEQSHQQNNETDLLGGTGNNDGNGNGYGGFGDNNNYGDNQANGGAENQQQDLFGGGFDMGGNQGFDNHSSADQQHEQTQQQQQNPSDVFDMFS